MTSIGVIAKDSRKEVSKVIESLEAWAKDKESELVYEADTARLFKMDRDGVPIEKIAEVANPIVTLGGDGTLIRVARYAAESEAVILGVNFGNLGFLTEVTPDKLLVYLESVLAGNAKLATRTMLRADVYRSGKKIFSSKALNDAVILKSSKGSLIDLDISQGENEMMRLRADGLIFATPTGSTAYSMAAGGPIAFPNLSVVLVTPICPHSLTNRPLVMPLDEEYNVEIPETDEELVLSMDGQEHLSLNKGDRVLITKAKVSVQFVKSTSQSYFQILRTKLNWAVANKS